jgi:hypothetical protein
VDKIGPAAVAVVASIIGLAMVAVVLSKNAQTPQVINAAGSALGGIIGQAVAPVSGSGGGFGGVGSIIGGMAQ